MEYVVKVQANATKHELRWAWRFTVLSRADGRCQWCGKECYLDACHVESRAARPDLEFDPSNGIALCRSCHMALPIFSLVSAESWWPTGKPRSGY